MGGREISYSDGDDLGFSKETAEDYTPTPVKVALIDTKKPDGEEESYENAEESI